MAGPIREREMFYLTTHSTHFIYRYMASDIWLRTILIVRKETRCRHIGYSYRLTARVLLYAPSHRQDNTYHGLCYTSRGALAGTRNSSILNRKAEKKKKEIGLCENGHTPFRKKNHNMCICVQRISVFQLMQTTNRLKVFYFISHTQN